ncbi:general stress protein [Frondihabitans sp. 4ASC-45]|uniref:general stress protein n=1 Tax=Frondihabitans sp. 4ASC-45 TaxID=3111636 RepID=UPI003C16D39E
MTDPTPTGPARGPSDDTPTERPAVPQYGEYAAPGTQPVVPPQQPQAESTGSAAESAGGVGAFVGGAYPQVVATFTKYEDAQGAVDYLSDEGFPVQNVSIVGHDIRTVENVSGRLTKGKAASRGGLSGLWFGLFLGLLFAVFVPGVQIIPALLTAIVVGALWGALFGFVGHAMTRGQRDFSSVKTMEAGRYEVLVRGEFATKAQQMLTDNVYK